MSKNYLKNLWDPTLFLATGFYFCGFFAEDLISYFVSDCYDLIYKGMACTWNGDFFAIAISAGGIYWLWLLIHKVRNNVLSRGQYLFMTSGFIAFVALEVFVYYLGFGCFNIGMPASITLCGPTGHVLTAAVLLLTLIWVRYLIIEIQARAKRSR